MKGKPDSGAYLPTLEDIAAACDQHREHRLAASMLRETLRKRRILEAESATRVRKRLATLDACRDHSAF
jgi:hypothetical protein